MGTKLLAVQRLYKGIEGLVADLDRTKIMREVEHLRQSHPELGREALAGILTSRAALQAATVGAAAGSAGGPIGLLAMAPDLFNLVRQQSKLILSIAFLYGHDPSVPERYREVLATLAVSAGTAAGRQGVRKLVVSGMEHKVAERLAKRIAGRYAARKLPALAPIVGSVIGGALNYMAVRATGRVAAEYYARLAHEGLALPAVAEPVLVPDEPRLVLAAASPEAPMSIGPAIPAEPI